MSNKGRPGGPTGPRDHKRPAPTIDLTATEVAAAAESAAPTEPAAADSGPPAEAAPPSEPVAADPGPAAASPSDPAPVEAPPPVEDPPPVEAPPPQAAAASSEDAEPARSGRSWLVPVAAGAIAVALTLIVLAAAGVFSRRDSGNNAVEAQIARLQQQVNELAARPAPSPVAPKAVEGLAARLARLEAVAATPRPPVTDTALANRIATLEGEIKALGERIAVLGRRNDEIASIAGEARKQTDATTAAVAEWRKAQAAAGSAVQRGDLDALANRMAALERISKAIEAQLGSRLGAESTDRSLRTLVVAGALGGAVDRGRPFVAELEAAKAVAPDAKALAPLERFAKAGIPSTDALAQELAALTPALAKAVGSPPRGGSGILDRLKANAEKLVQVRPIKDAIGDDPAALVQRIEARAAEHNLAGALSEIAKLPAPARDLTKEWVAKVEARNAAVEASRRLYAAALAALGKPSL